MLRAPIMGDVQAALRGVTVHEPCADVQAARYAGMVAPGSFPVHEPRDERFQEVLHDSLHDSKVGVVASGTVTTASTLIEVRDQEFPVPLACRLLGCVVQIDFASMEAAEDFPNLRHVID